MPAENQVRSNSSNNSREPNAKGKISPELVRQVAERVYRMLRDDLQLERERARLGSGLRTGGFRG